MTEAGIAPQRASLWRRFWHRRDPTPLLLLSLVAAFWLAPPGSGKLWVWYGEWRVGQAMDAIAPLQAMVESTTENRGSCPELFLRDGATLAPAIHRVHVSSRIFTPYCSIQIDFQGGPRTHVHGHIFLVWKHNRWGCIKPVNKHFPALADCTKTWKDFASPEQPSGDPAA